MKKLSFLVVSSIILSFVIFCGFAGESNVQAQVRNRSNVKSKITKKKKRRIVRVSDEQVTNLVGNWSGTFDQQPATIEIVSVEGATFQGTMTQAGSQIAFTGFIEKNNRRITMIETKVVASDNGWVLGLNKGRLANRGNRMWGSGKDANRPYSWSFKKN